MLTTEEQDSVNSILNSFNGKNFENIFRILMTCVLTLISQSQNVVMAEHFFEMVHAELENKFEEVVNIIKNRHVA